MSDTYTLYGSYASYYTAKVRAYLRKKGIPFVERLPSDPMFRNKVRPASGSHRIPQLMAPDGEVIQDSVEIVDFLNSLTNATEITLDGLYCLKKFSKVPTLELLKIFL